MWNAIILESSSNKLSFRLEEKSTMISHRQFLTLLSESHEFIHWYNSLLADCLFDAFFWENKPVTNSSANELYECTLVNSDQLSGVPPDATTFDSYFKKEAGVVSFLNLGGDAQLVVPCPVGDDAIYTHIGNFVRKAPRTQLIDFWSWVGHEMLNHIQAQPRWLSTSGLGVYWLHVRIDSVPKYYQTEEYKTV